MHNIIEIDGLNFSYNDKKIFDDFELNIKEKRFITILGKSGSGKSTLAKILLGLKSYDGSIIIDGISLNKDSVNYLRRKIGVVFENPNRQFVTNIVRDDLAFTLENLDYYPVDIRNRIDTVSNYIGITELLNKDINTLSGGEKQLIALAEAIIHEPEILILDEALSMIDSYYLAKILNILMDLNKQGMTIINITHDSEQAIYGTDIVIINDGKVVLNKTTKKAFKEEKIFIASGLELPFIIDLSIKLGYYDLISKDKLYLDSKSLVNAIWK